MLQLIVNGLAVGSVYGLLALGMFAIFNTTRIMNFAHGEMAMVSTFIAYTLMQSLQFPYWLALLGAGVFAIGFGLLVERAVVHPMSRGPELSIGIAGLGLLLIFSNAALIIWGPFPRPMVGMVPQGMLDLGGVMISQQHLAGLVLGALISVCFFAFFKFTKLGTAVRASSQNETAAVLMGINPGRISMVIWPLGIVLGLLAGMIIAPIRFLSFSMMFPILMSGFAGALLGGMTSLPGVFVGGLLIGVFENLFGSYVSSDMRSVLPFLVIIVVLMVKPTGLFGRFEAPRV